MTGRKRKVWFTGAERGALKVAIGFITAGEWSETLSQRQYDALMTAREKIEMDRADSIANLSDKPSERDVPCTDCGKAVDINSDGLCWTCRDIRAEKGKSP